LPVTKNLSESQQEDLARTGKKLMTHGDVIAIGRGAIHIGGEGDSQKHLIPDEWDPIIVLYTFGCYVKKIIDFFQVSDILAMYGSRWNWQSFYAPGLKTDFSVSIFMGCRVDRVR
jgi:hypothetical protein